MKTVSRFRIFSIILPYIFRYIPIFSYIFLYSKIYFSRIWFSLITIWLRILSKRESASGKGGLELPTRSRKKRFIQILCLLLNGGNCDSSRSPSSKNSLSKSAEKARLRISPFSSSVKKSSSSVCSTSVFTVRLSCPILSS